MARPAIFTPNINPKAATTKRRRYIPQTLELDRSDFKEHIKVLKSAEGYIVTISPLLNTALKELQRGRSTHEKEQSKSNLAKLVQERIPSQVRSCLKNTENKFNNGTLVVLTEVVDYDNNNFTITFINPALK